MVRFRTRRRPRNINFFSVPKIWNGECFILGGGPSLNEVDVSRLRGHRVIAVNNAYRLGDWDVMFFGDCEWFPRHKEPLLRFAGLKLCRCPKWEKMPGIKVLETANAPLGRLSEDPDVVLWNKSSGACAINIATLLGARRIVLLGFDMQKYDDSGTPNTEGTVHNWHDEHGFIKQKKITRNPYPDFIKPMGGIALDLKKMGIECVNASTSTALEVFPVVHPDEVLPKSKAVAL